MFRAGQAIQQCPLYSGELNQTLAHLLVANAMHGCVLVFDNYCCTDNIEHLKNSFSKITE